MKKGLRNSPIIVGINESLMGFLHSKVNQNAIFFLLLTNTGFLTRLICVTPLQNIYLIHINQNVGVTFCHVKTLDKV